MNMSRFIALENIGDYKKGDEVPAEKAQVWNSMYAKSVAELVEDAPSKPKAEPAPEPSESEVVHVDAGAAKKPKKLFGGRK